MSGIGSAPPPPSPPPGGSGQPAQPPQTPQVIQNPPVDLAKLAIGAKVDARVLQLITNSAGTTTGAQISLATPSGPVNVTVRLNLPPNAQLTFQVQGQQSGSTIISLTQINGQPVTSLPGGPNLTPGLTGLGLAQAGGAGATGTPSAPIGLGGTMAVNLQPAKPGDQVIASFLRPSNMASTPQPNLLSPGGTLTPTNPLTTTTPTQQPMGLTTGNQAPQGSMPTTAPQNMAGANPNPSGLKPQALPISADAGTATKPNQTLPIGTQMGVKITAITAPSVGNSFPSPNPAATMPSLSAGTALTGVVTGTTSHGVPIVQTHGGMLALNGSGPLPAGTKLSFEIIQTPRIPPGPMPEGFQQAQQMGLKEGLLHWKSWPTVGEAAQALAQVSPQQAAQFAAQIPKADNQLAANLLMFLGVLKTGDMKSWMGEQSSRILQRTRPDVARKLSDDIKLASQISDEPRGDWRAHIIPFFNGQDIDKILMLTRHQPDEEEEDGKEKGKRFVLDINLSQLGRMQLDGLVKAKSKQVDLIIRTDNPLPRTMRGDIQNIYTEAGKITGMTGAVSFQAAPANFIDLPAPKAKNPSEGGVLA